MRVRRFKKSILVTLLFFLLILIICVTQLLPKYLKHLQRRPDYTDVIKRDKIKEMFLHAWKNYELYAWGANELKPVSKSGHSGSVFGDTKFGATIVDSMDTLFIMGYMDEFKRGRDWIEHNLNFSNFNGDVSVFETNIRFVGGLLTCYALTGDVMFRDKALHVADTLLPAFNTKTGIPRALVNCKTGNHKISMNGTIVVQASHNFNWAGGGSILAEIGTLHLEFTYLSDISGDPTYRAKVENIREKLNKMDKPRGLYNNYINPDNGNWGLHHTSLGALGDSFYEYLLKSWLQSGRTDVEARLMFDSAMQQIISQMMRNSTKGLLYVGDVRNDNFQAKMEHLACFAGGMFGMASQTLHNNFSEEYMMIAEGLTNTCHESYNRSATGLGPETFRFTDTVEAMATTINEKHYILRPETVESFFYMWRLTKDQKYRNWGWEAVQGLEKHCRVEWGYSGIKDVYTNQTQKDDVQQSYFLAETLKYLYLLYSDDSVLPLDEWVFNTEAHPLPIKGFNPLYRSIPTYVAARRHAQYLAHKLDNSAKAG